MSRVIQHVAGVIEFNKTMVRFMRNNIFSKTLYLFSLCSVMLLVTLYSAESSARNNVLDSIEVNESRDQSVIKISFTERLIYRSHAPKDKADLIHINVNFQSKFTAPKLGNESLIWNPNDTVPLFEVALEPTNRIQADLVLRFDDQVEFDVQGSPDSYSITVTVYHPQKEQPSIPSDQLNSQTSDKRK